jgi:hypothetical protein
MQNLNPALKPSHLFRRKHFILMQNLCDVKGLGIPYALFEECMHLSGVMRMYALLRYVF